MPVNRAVLGEKALRTCPDIEQILIGRPDPSVMSDDEFERKLFLCRNQIEDQAESQGIKDFYIPSFSSRTIVYKGLLAAPTLERFYLDLRDPNYTTALAVFHQRYSTNTFPTWPLSQSCRMLSHNGEINTVQGNRLWTKAREPELKSPLFGDAIKKLRPIIQPGGSDSASLDNALEVLVMGGRDILHSMLMLVPAAWQGDASTPTEVKEFYEYHQTLNEPWDGPAALVFSDGRTIGACLDRNGLRPARYKITEDGLFTLGSEVGLLTIDDAKVMEKGRLGPGEMIAIDTVNGTLLRNDEIKAAYAKRKPYGTWLRENIKDIESKPSLESQPSPGATLLQQQLAAGYTEEELGVDAVHSQDHGRDGRGSDRLDGRRRAAGRALEKAAPALYLFQATLRAGDQSADRPDPRKARHVGRGAGRRAPQLARGNAGARAAAAPAIARPDQSRDAADSRLEGRAFPFQHDLVPVPGQRRAGRPEEASRPHLRGGREGRR